MTTTPDGIERTQTTLRVEVCGLYGGGLAIHTRAAGEKTDVHLTTEEARHLVKQIIRILDRQFERETKEFFDKVAAISQPLEA